MKMDIVLRTGFLKIFHGIEFQPQAPIKGKKLIESNFVYDVEERRINDRRIIISGKVNRQTNVYQNFDIKLIVSVYNRITSEYS